MARMPDVRWEGEHSPERLMTRYDIVCIHTIVGQAPAHAAHFSTWADGTILQSRDTKYQSGANLEGNPRVIAIENADMPPSWNTADGHAVPAMTAQQVEACARIAAWCNQTHGIPLVANPNSRPTSRGVGYHRQGIDGNFGGYVYPGRVSGGELWTTSPGKVCPGDRRIKQTLEEIIPRAIAIAGGDTDMPTDAEIEAIVNGCLNRALDTLLTGAPNSGNPPGSSAAVDNIGVRGFLYRMGESLNTGVANSAWTSGVAPSTVDGVGLRGAIEAAVIDPAALAAELAPLIVAELPDSTTLTEQQMQNALLAALTGSPLIPKVS